MKKKTKKLVLSKETVKNVKKEELAQVQGGYSARCPSVGLCPREPTTFG